MCDFQYCLRIYFLCLQRSAYPERITAHNNIIPEPMADMCYFYRIKLEWEYAPEGSGAAGKELTYNCTLNTERLKCSTGARKGATDDSFPHQLTLHNYLYYFITQISAYGNVMILNAYVITINAVYFCNSYQIGFVNP